MWKVGGEKLKTSLKELLNDVKNALLNRGEALKLNRRHRPQYIILILVLVLSVLGFIIVFSAAPGMFSNIYSTGGGECKIFNIIPADSVIDCEMTEFLVMQVVYLVVGFLVFFIASKVSLYVWRRFALLFLIGAFVLSIILYVSYLAGWPLAIEAGGAVRWLNFGIFTFQPAELMKLALLMFSASFLATAKSKGELDSIKKTLLPLMTVVLIGLAMVVVLQSDLSSGIVILAIILAQMIISNMRARNILGLFLSFAFAGVVAIMMFPYRLGRVVDFFSTECGLGQELEQICSAMMSLGSGGLIGKGLGQSLSVFWVPQVMDDAAFSLVGETFGFVGAVAVIVIFAALIFRILNLANYLTESYLRLVIAGAFAWVASQVIINIAAFTQSMPLTGITLPFISSGGSSLICIMAAMGVVFNISRYTSHSKVERSDDENTMRRRGLGGTYYSGRGNNHRD